MQVVVQEEGIVGLEKVMVGAVQRPCTGLIDLQCAIWLCLRSPVECGTAAYARGVIGVEGTEARGAKPV